MPALLWMHNARTALKSPAMVQLQEEFALTVLPPIGPQVLAFVLLAPIALTIVLAVVNTGQATLVVHRATVDTT